MKKDLLNYKIIFDHTGDSIFIAGLDGKIIEVNESAVLQTGYSHSELTKMHLADIDANYNKDQIEGILRLVSQSDNKTFESVHKRKDNSLLPVEIKLNFCINQDKQYVIVIARDIYERKFNERVLEESEERYHSLFTNMEHGTLIIDQDGFIRDANPAALKILNSEYSKLVGKSLFDTKWRIIDEDLNELDPENNPFTIALSSKQIITNQVIGICDPTLKRFTWVNSNFIPVFRENFIGISRIFLTFSDITLQKETQEMLKSAQFMLKTVINSIPHSVFWKSTNSIFLGCNKKFAEFAGYSEPEEIIGKNDYDMVWKDQAELYREDDKNVMQSGRSKLNYIEPLLDNNGNLLQIETSKMPLVDKSGEIYGILGIFTDVTEKMKIEKQLQILSLAIEQSPLSIIITDQNGTIEYANRHFSMITGYSTEEVYKQRPNILKSGKTSDETYSQLWKTINSGEVWNGELINKKKKGDLYWEYASISPVKNNDGIVTHFVAIKEDITEKRKSTEALLKSEERFRQIAENSDEWIWEFDVKGLYTYSNPAVNKILGFRREEIINNKYFYDFVVKGKKSEAANKTFQIIKNAANIEEMIYEIIDSQGNELVLLRKGMPFFNENNKLIGYRGVDINLTEQRRAIKEFQNALEQEKQLNELKSRFVSTTSHEFKTPLTTILSSTEFIELLTENDENPKLFEHLHRIKKSVNRMKDLMDDVLLINKFETGKLLLTPQKVNLKTLIVDILNENKALFNTNHKLIKRINLERDQFILDKKTVNLILNNLLSNAVKYSPEGGEIILELTNINNKLLISVTDNGIGIEEKDTPHLFESFHRGNNVGNIPGTGLGLSIVKRSVEMHHGNISFKSIPGSGTSFIVELPELTTD